MPSRSPTRHEELIKGDQGHTVLCYHCTEETLADVGGHPGDGSDNFEKSPPDATLAVVSEDDAEHVVVTLTNPRLDGDTLRYDVTVVEGPAMCRAVLARCSSISSVCR